MFIIWKTTITIFYRSLSTKITKSVEKHKFLYPVGSGNEEWVKQLTNHCVHLHGKMVCNVGLSSSPLSSFVVSWALRHRAMSRNNVSTMRLTVCLHFWCTLPALSETANQNVPSCLRLALFSEGRCFSLLTHSIPQQSSCSWSKN